MTGDLQVGIPKLHEGSFLLSLLEPRPRIDQALHAVIMEAYIHRVSSRSVDDLAVAVGFDSRISTSEVSHICAGIDKRVNTSAAAPSVSSLRAAVQATMRRPTKRQVTSGCFFHIRSSCHTEVRGRSRTVLR